MRLIIQIISSINIFVHSTLDRIKISMVKCASNKGQKRTIPFNRIQMALNFKSRLLVRASS